MADAEVMEVDLPHEGHQPEQPFQQDLVLLQHWGPTAPAYQEPVVQNFLQSSLMANKWVTWSRRY